MSMEKKFSLLKAFALPLVLLFVLATAPGAFAQLNTSAESTTPLVYDVENTGASYMAPSFPDFAHLPIIRPLPDAFRFADGSYNTSFAAWEKRRNEIKAAVEKYEIGTKPDCHDCTIDATYTPPAAGSNAGSLKVVVTRTTNGKQVTINSRVYIPQGMGSGPFPVLIPMSLAFPPFFVPALPNYGSLPASAFANLPIATIDFFHNDVTQYSFSGTRDSSGDPFYQMYPELCSGLCAGKTSDGISNSGQYAAWSWGVSRLIDGIIKATQQSTNPLPIDVKHIAVTGCSYAGKMALFAGAFDERIALTVAQENGGGGAAAWRITDEIEAFNASEDIQRTDYNWFAGQMKQFAGVNRYKLPTDHHELMAMIAPRALLETGNTDFYWLSNRSNYISARATQQIYNTFGIGDRFGFYIDGGHNHCATLPAEGPVITAWVQKFLLGDTTANTDTHVFPTNPPLKYDYTKLDYARWTAWWGTNDPRFPNDWNPGDGTVVTYMNRPLNINVADKVLAGYDLYLDGPHPAATVQLAGGNVQSDISCPDGSSFTLQVGLPGQTYSIPALDNNWYPSPNQKSASTYQGSATNNATAACSGGSVKDSYFQAVGTATGTGNPGTPGFISSDTTDPLNFRFHCTVDGSTTGAGGSWSPTTTVKYQP